MSYGVMGWRLLGGFLLLVSCLIGELVGELVGQ